MCWWFSCPQLLLPPLQCHVSGDTRPQLREHEQSAGQLPSARGPPGAGDMGWGHGLATAGHPHMASTCLAQGLGLWGWQLQPYPQSPSPTACCAQIHVFCFLSLFGCVFNSLLGLQGNSFRLLGFLPSCFISDQCRNRRRCQRT